MAKVKSFNIDTFNIHGLPKDLKNQQLSTELERLEADICCIQETKIKKIDTLTRKECLICLESDVLHYGLGVYDYSKTTKKFLEILEKKSLHSFNTIYPKSLKTNKQIQHHYSKYLCHIDVMPQK